MMPLWPFFDKDYVEGENDGKTQEDCLQKFSSRDYIMEPAIFSTLKTYAAFHLYLQVDFINTSLLSWARVLKF